jgi:hypothetical protein
VGLDAGQRRVEPLAQFAHQAGERVGEVAVGAAAEAVPLHHDRAPEPRRVVEPRAGFPALCLAQQRSRQRDAVAFQAGADDGPVTRALPGTAAGGGEVVEQACGLVHRGSLFFCGVWVTASGPADLVTAGCPVRAAAPWRRGGG